LRRSSKTSWADWNRANREEQMDTTLESVLKIWQRLGVQNSITASEADIVSFEQKYNVTLAAIVRDYFTLLNGTTGGKLGMDDENLVGFWHIDQVRPLAEECPEYATGDEPNLFVFADYSIWAHAYAMRLTKGQDSATPVLLIGGNRALQIAPTFEDFFRRYVAHDESMLFPRINSTLP
jgi:SMI1/KNR4 family protein SUKH-1